MAWFFLATTIIFGVLCLAHQLAMTGLIYYMIKEGCPIPPKGEIKACIREALAIRSRKK